MLSTLQVLTESQFFTRAVASPELNANGSVVGTAVGVAVQAINSRVAAIKPRTGHPSHGSRFVLPTLLIVPLEREEKRLAL